MRAAALRRMVFAGYEMPDDRAGDGSDLDFQDPGTFASATEGCTALFLLRPPPIADMKATLNPFIVADHVATWTPTTTIAP